MDSQLVPLFCNDDDVIAFGNNTYKIGKLQKVSNQSLDDSLASKYIAHLTNKGIVIDRAIFKEYIQVFKNGIDCEVLKTDAKGWRKGKFRLKVSLEILAENFSDSSLDDIRQAINDSP